jgi:hypothetical protein
MQELRPKQMRKRRKKRQISFIVSDFLFWQNVNDPFTNVIFTSNDLITMRQYSTYLRYTLNVLTISSIVIC